MYNLVKKRSTLKVIIFDTNHERLKQSAQIVNVINKYVKS